MRALLGEEVTLCRALYDLFTKPVLMHD